MPCRTASSASSPGVHWLMGRPPPAASPGGVQASAMTWHSCSGVNVGGAPGRGASARTPSATASSAASSPSTSAASSASAAAPQRARHTRAVSRVTPT